MRLTKSTIFVLIIGMIITGQIFQFFTQFTRIPVFWPSITVLLLFTLVLNPRVFLSNSVLKTLLLFLVLTILKMGDHLMNLPDTLIKPFGIFSMVFPYLVTALILENISLLKSSDKTILRKIGMVFLLIFFASIIVTLINEMLFPGITRGAHKTNLPRWAWAMSFGSIYGIPFFLMTIVAYYRQNNFKLIIYISIILLLLIRAGFLTALILTIVTAITGLLFRLKIKRTYFVMSLIILFSLFALYNLNVFISILPELPNQAYQQKANDIIEMQKRSGTNDLIFGTRQGVYFESIVTVIKAPFFGTGDYNDIGQHSYWLDKIGFIGIFGLFFYILVLKSLYKKSISLLNKDETQFYNILSILVIGYLFLNPSEWPDFWLIIFVSIPSLIVFFRKETSLA